MLVGNKVDLAEEDSSKRQVSWNEGKQLATHVQNERKINIRFMETSATASIRVESAF